MKVDLVVAFEPWPTELEVISSIVDGFSETKGAAPILVIVLAKIATHSSKQLIQRFKK